MHQYLTDTEFAAKGLIALLTQDAQELEKLVAQQKNASAKEATFNVVFMQNEMQHTANYWYGRYYEAALERLSIQQQIAFLEAQIIDKHVSLEALAGALLQLAKQGISSVHKNPGNCPRPGRQVHGAELRWVIWAGRNQSQHYEEPRRINAETAGVFAQLNAAGTVDKLLDPKSRTNLAFEVVTLLGWHDYAQYEQDMVSLIS